MAIPDWGDIRRRSRYGIDLAMTVSEIPGGSSVEATKSWTRSVDSESEGEQLKIGGIGTQECSVSTGDGHGMGP